MSWSAALVNMKGVEFPLPQGKVDHELASNLDQGRKTDNCHLCPSLNFLLKSDQCISQNPDMLDRLLHSLTTPTLL